MSQHEISWMLPWRALQFQPEIPHVQKQYEMEIAPPHPLWGKKGQVIGRRVDCDDVVVALNDGTYAIVHLVWASGPGPGAFPAQYPSAVFYKSLGEFVAAMNEDAEEYVRVET